MTLLSICTQIANDIPLAAPASIVGNTGDETAVRLLASAQNAGEALARKPQGGWVNMIREYDFTTQARAAQAGTIGNVGGFGVISGLGITVTINNASGSTTALALTAIDESAAIPSGRIVSKIGIYQTAAKTVTLKIVKKNFPGNYDIVVSQSFAHPGGGWADLTLSSPYTVPVGSYYLAAWSSGTSDVVTAPVVGAFVLTTDVVGVGQTFTENPSGGTWALRYTTTTSPVTADGTWYAFGNGVPNNAIVTAVTDNSVTFNQPATASGTGLYSFGKSDYDLPPDFERVIDDTMWDRSRYWQMRGPMSPQQWQMYKSSIISQATIERRFRFRRISGAMRFSIDPVPTDNGSPLVFEYVSNGWCQSEAGVAQNSWQADTDTGILDEYLLMLGTRWRVLRRLGFTYSEELSEYESEVRKAMAADGGAAILSIVPRSNFFLINPHNNIPESGFGGPAS